MCLQGLCPQKFSLGCDGLHLQSLSVGYGAFLHLQHLLMGYDDFLMGYDDFLMGYDDFLMGYGDFFVGSLMGYGYEQTPWKKMPPQTLER